MISGRAIPAKKDNIETIEEREYGMGYPDAATCVSDPSIMV